MLMLLALMIILAVRSVTLSGAGEGLAFFYLVPDFAKVKEAGLMEVVFAAMGQSFFTLSLGIGAIAIFGMLHRPLQKSDRRSSMRNRS